MLLLLTDMVERASPYQILTPLWLIECHSPVSFYFIFKKLFDYLIDNNLIVTYSLLKNDVKHLHKHFE